MRSARVLAAVVGATVGLLATAERDAAACGGCLQPPVPPNVTETESVITDEQMIFSISQDQTTLYDEIQYSGAPADFAWVLPIKGTVTVGLSADILFQTINALTATTVTSPPTHCPAPPTCGGGGGGCGAGAAFNLPAGAEDLGDGSAGGAPPVTVIARAQVGPYETVQLHSTDGSALSGWLAAHDYVIPSADAQVIASYVAAQFDFLALRLIPGKGVNAMQPVRVTSKGASVSLPLHMVAVGTGATTGITIYVVADGRWEPQNFPTFTIQSSDITWDWTTSSSNYETLRLAKEATFGGKGWQIESSLSLSQYAIQGGLGSAIQGNTGGLGGYPASAPDAGAGEAGAREAGEAAATDAGEPSEDDAGDGYDAGYYGGNGGYYGSPLPPAAVDDLQVLFAGIAAPNVRITRMRSDVAHTALSEDMFLQASADQGELSNEHVAGKESGQPLCPVYDDACNVTGEAPRDQAVATANGGCNTIRARSQSPTTLAILLSAAGFLVVRVRRRRRER